MENIVYWASQPPEKAKTLPLTITYHFKWEQDIMKCTRKARCTVRGGLIRAYIHYHPTQTQFPTGEKSTSHTHLEIAMEHCCGIQHMYIFNSYVD